MTELTGTKLRWWLVVVVALTAAILVVAPRTQVARADAAGIGGDFIPLANPVRVVDTRNGTGGVTGVRGADSMTAFSVLGTGGIPATGVSAVLIDIAPVSPTASTWLEVWEDGTPRPASSTVNVPANSAIVSNTAIVPVSSAGKIDVYNSSGNVHVAIDVQGYFSAVQGGSGRGGFVPTTHTKIVNTIDGVGAPRATIPAKGNLTVQVTGSVIPTGANAAFLDILVMSASTPGWIAAYPSGGTSGNSVLDYAAGMTASGVAVKLGSDGKAVFVNNGTSAINLQLLAQGYFTGDSTTGAGLRKASGRLLNGVILGANATVDIAVGGRFGLPTTGIAGAAINLTTLSQTQTGYLKAWPLDAAEPNASLANYSANVPRADQAIVKPGTEGKIRVKNVGNATVRLYADLQGWFADLVAPLPVERNTRVTAFQAAGSGGAIEYAYVDNTGQVVRGRQTDLHDFSNVQWTTLSGNDSFTGRPSYAESGSGFLLVVQHTDTGIRSISTQGGVIWQPWVKLGGSSVTSPVVAKQPDGSLVEFIVDSDSRVWRLEPNATEPSWTSLGDAHVAGPPTVAQIADGLQLFALTISGSLQTAIYRAGALSTWTNLGGTGLAGSPTVVVTAGWRSRVIVRGADGTLMTKLQNADGTFPTAWYQIGDFVSAGPAAAVVSPITNKIEVVARGMDNEMYVSDETAPGSGAWETWDLFRNRTTPPTTTPDRAVSDPTITTFADTSDTGYVVTFRNVSNQLRTFPTYPASGSQAKAAALPTDVVVGAPSGGTH
jgi:hypothetical protein